MSGKKFIINKPEAKSMSLEEADLMTIKSLERQRISAFQSLHNPNSLAVAAAFLPDGPGALHVFVADLISDWVAKSKENLGSLLGADLHEFKTNPSSFKELVEMVLEDYFSHNSVPDPLQRALYRDVCRLNDKFRWLWAYFKEEILGD